MRVHHIAYAVNSISDECDKFFCLGWKRKGKIFIDEKRNIQILFLENDADKHIIELVEPIGKTNSIYKLLEKNRGVSVLYHICYETEEMDKELALLKEKGFILVEKPEKAIAIQNKKVVFVFSSQTGLIELVEK